LFSLSLRAFFQNNNRGLTGCAFTADGSVVNRDNQGNLVLQIASMSSPKLLSQSEKTESFTKALTASILLIGMSLPDKERQSSLLIKTYQNMDQNRKYNLLTALGRLLAKNNPVRTWIKENRLDAENGFDWDLELAYLLFFGIYVQHAKNLTIPQEMKPGTLKNFSSQTRRVMLNFALEYTENLRRSKLSAELSDFIMQMETMEMTGDMRKKLDLFNQKVNLAISATTVGLD